MNDKVDKLVIFLAKRDGIDKLVKTFQYVSKLLVWHLETTNPNAAHRAKQCEVASGLSRKAFRTGRFLTGFNALRRSPGPTPTYRVLSVFANAGEMVYFFFDHFLWLSRTGVIDANLARRMSFISAFGESLGGLELPWTFHKSCSTFSLEIHPLNPSHGCQLHSLRTRQHCSTQMADGDIQSRYVKLNKDQAPIDINPGELNQPIEVPQLNVRKCNECGQPLPESFEPPAVEPWSTGIFGCAEDTESCWTGLFCPCVLFGRNYENLREDMPWTTPCVCHAIFVEGGMALAAATAALHGIEPQTTVLIWEGLLFTWWVCGIYTGIVRQMLQKKYHLKNSPCDPCLVHCCLHWCALCQEHREMKGRLSDNAVMPMAIVNSPPVQVMKSDEEKKESSENGHDHGTHLEMQSS